MWPWRGYTLGAHLARAMSTLMGAATVLLVWWIARAVLPGREWLALAAAATVAFLPQFASTSASLSNDNLIIMLSTAALALLLRLSYWIAAVADFCIAIVVLIPERMGVSEIVYPMGLMSAVAFSWAVMLLIADRKPLERSWVLIPTILVVGLLTTVVAVFALNKAVEFSIGFFVFGISLTVFMVYSYFSASKSTI